MSKRKPSDVSFITPSFDGMRDIWELYAHTFKIYWKSHPTVMKLGVETIDFDCAPFQTIKTGKNSSYSTVIRELAKNLKTKWVIVGVDDFPLSDDVNMDSLNEVLDEAERLDADFVNLLSMPLEIASLFEKSVANSPLKQMEYGSPYSVALGIGLWTTSSLLEVITDNMSAWEIERLCSQKKYDRNLKLFRLGERLRGTPPFKCVNLIQSQKWTRTGIEFCGKHDFPIDFEVRGVEKLKTRRSISIYEYLRYFIFFISIKCFGRHGARLLTKLAHTDMFKFQN